jgi:hypothetical protein
LGSSAIEPITGRLSEHIPLGKAQRLRREAYESPALPLSYSATGFVLRSTRGLSSEHPPRIPTVDNSGNSAGRAFSYGAGSGMLVAGTIWFLDPVGIPRPARGSTFLLASSPRRPRGRRRQRPRPQGRSIAPSNLMGVVPGIGRRAKLARRIGRGRREQRPDPHGLWQGGTTRRSRPIIATLLRRATAPTC